MRGAILLLPTYLYGMLLNYKRKNLIIILTRDEVSIKQPTYLSFPLLRNLRGSSALFSSILSL